MILRLLIFAFIILCSEALFEQVSAESIVSLEQDIGITSDKIGFAQEDIKNYQNEIARIEKRIKRYGKMAADAKQQAKESTHQSDKEHWSESAKNREKLADDLRSDIQKLEAKIKDKQKEIADLKAGRYSTEKELQTEIKERAESQERVKEASAEARRKERNSDTCQFDKAEDIIGLWAFNDDQDAEPLAIVQKDPLNDAYPNNLELHSKHRSWSGTFNSAPDVPADEPRMVFKYTPEAGEINEDIPDEVAAAIEGQLEWELEVLADCQNGATMLYAMFYPGEVEWNEDLSSHEIIGRGEARRSDLNPVIDIESALAYETAIGVQIDKKQDPFFMPPEAIIQRQPFHIAVRLAPEKAKSAGKKLSLKIEGLKNGESDTITLKAQKSKKGLPVYYSHKKPVTIADSRSGPSRKPGILSMDWIFGNEGSRFNLDAEDGEMLRFSYQGVRFDVPVYDSVFSRGHAMYQQAAAESKAVFGGFVKGDSVARIVLYSGEKQSLTIKEEDKLSAEVALQMIRNYELLANSDALHLAHKLRIGQEYFGSTGVKGLLDLTDEDIKKIEAHEEAHAHLHSSIEQDDPLMNPLTKAALEGMLGRAIEHKPGTATKDENLAWTSGHEKRVIERAIRTTSSKMREDFQKDFMKALSYGFYTGVLMIPSFGEELVIVMEGTDAFGKKKRGWERINAMISIGSEAVLAVGTSSLAQQISRQAKIQKRVATEVSKQVSHYSGVPEQAKHAIDTVEDANLPKKMTPDQKTQTRLSFDPEPDDLPFGGSVSNPSARCALKPGTKAPRVANNLAEQVYDAVESAFSIMKSKRPQYLRNRYPDGVRVVEDFSDKITMQSHNSVCQGKVLTWFGFKDKKFEIPEDMMHTLMMQEAKNETRQHLLDRMKRRGYTSASAWKIGYYNFMVRKVARRLGYAALEIRDPRKNNKKLRIRHIGALLKQGYHIKVGIYLQNSAGRAHGKHAVSVEKIITNARGYAEKVHIYDPNVASILEISADDFKRMLITDGPYGNITVFKRGAKRIIY